MKSGKPAPPSPLTSKNGIPFTDPSYDCKFVISFTYNAARCTFSRPPGALCVGVHTCSWQVNSLSNNRVLGHSAKVLRHNGAASVAAQLIFKGGNVMDSSRVALAASGSLAAASSSVLYRVSKSATSILVGDTSDYTYVYAMTFINITYTHITCIHNTQIRICAH